MVNKSFYDKFPDDETSEKSVNDTLNDLREMVGKERVTYTKKEKKEIPIIPIADGIKPVETSVSVEMMQKLLDFISEMNSRISGIEDGVAGRDAKISQIGNKYETFKNLSTGLDLTNLERVAHLLENTETVCTERMKAIREILDKKREFVRKSSYLGYAEVIEQALKEDALMFDRILSHKSSERNELDMYVRKTQDKFNLFEN